ncbi:DUF1259 domain-containing protein [Nocardia sp. NPDC046763]
MRLQGAGKAAVNGDFAPTATEIDKVIDALRTGGIDVGAQPYALRRLALR